MDGSEDGTTLLGAINMAKGLVMVEYLQVVLAAAPKMLLLLISTCNLSDSAWNSN